MKYQQDVRPKSRTSHSEVNVLATGLQRQDLTCVVLLATGTSYFFVICLHPEQLLASLSAAACGFKLV